jgi:hypothetical protein
MRRMLLFIVAVACGDQGLLHVTMPPQEWILQDPQGDLAGAVFVQESEGVFRHTETDTNGVVRVRTGTQFLTEPVRTDTQFATLTMVAPADTWYLRYVVAENAVLLLRRERLERYLPKQ